VYSFSFILIIHTNISKNMFFRQNDVEIEKLELMRGEIKIVNRSISKTIIITSRKAEIML